MSRTLRAKRLCQLAHQRYDDGIEPWPEQGGRLVVARAPLGRLQLRPLDGLQQPFPNLRDFHNAQITF
jgi:hypothetical protein